MNEFNRQTNKLNRNHFIISALIGLVLFGLFRLVQPAYFKFRQKNLIRDWQARVNTLKIGAGPDEQIAHIQNAKELLQQLQKIRYKLALSTPIYENDYIVLDQLEQNYQYDKLFRGLMAKIFEYDPENDLNSRSVSENKGDFMYRLSLAQNALKQITINLETHDNKPTLASYTKQITNMFGPMIGLIDELVTVTNKNQVEKSNQLRSQYITGFKRLQQDLELNIKQVQEKLDTENQRLIAKIYRPSPNPLRKATR